MSIEKPWPDDTFVWEDENQEHYCGSHWEVFFDSPDEILQSLPEIIPDLVHLPTFDRRPRSTITPISATGLGTKPENGASSF